MRRLVVLIPEGYFVDYFVYSIETDEFSSGGSLRNAAGCNLEWGGRFRFRGEGTTGDDIRKLIGKYSPEAIAIRILYGGEEFGKTQIYDRHVLERLSSLAPQSPLHIPAAVKLIKTLERSVPTPEIFLYFETAFFVDLPLRERTYALDGGPANYRAPSTANIRRFGYRGLFHNAAYKKIIRTGLHARRILSVCLEPNPEVVGIYDGKPVTVSGGSTPAEGLPGNTICGEIDPGIVFLLEEKKKWGPEMINDMLARRSGLTALAGERVTIEDVINGGSKYVAARDLFEYRILLSCGSAAGVMNGIDAVAFSGRYVGAAEKLSEWLLPKLTNASAESIKLPVIFMNDSLDRVIAESYCRSQMRAIEL